MSSRIAYHPVFFLALILIGSLLLPSCAFAQRGDWWMDHHDAQHAGRSIFSGPAVPAQKWAYDSGGTIWSHPALAANGTLYFGNNNGTFTALKPDGTPLWQYSMGSAVGSSPAIGKDGTIYVAGTNSSFYALNPDGSLKWRYMMSAGTGSSPSIAADDTIYICAGTSLYALTPNGTLKWQHSFTSSISWSTALGNDGTVYVLPSDHKLYAINPANGSQKWISPAGDFNSPQTIAPDGTIYLGGLVDRKLYALNPADGTVKWSCATDGTISYSPALGADGTIYTGVSGATIVYAINPDGSLRWKYNTQGITVDFSPSVGADGTIYIGSNSPTMLALNADGTSKWIFATSGIIMTPPIIGDNNLLYLGSGSKLYAISNAPPCPVFNLGKSASSTSVLPGTTITYTLTYANIGAASATNVLLTDILPAHLTFLADSASNNGTYNTTTRTVSWTSGAVPDSFVKTLVHLFVKLTCPVCLDNAEHS